VYSLRSMASSMAPYCKQYRAIPVWMKYWSSLSNTRAIPQFFRHGQFQTQGYHKQAIALKTKRLESYRFVRENKTGVVRVFVFFQHRYMFSHISGELSPRPFEFYD